MKIIEARDGVRLHGEPRVGTVVFDDRHEVTELIAQVIRALYARLPRLVRMFVSEDRILDLIADAIRRVAPQLLAPDYTRP